MRRWSIGINDYYFTASIWLEDAPWYIFVIEYVIQFICNCIPRIPLPRIKIIRGNKETTLKDWYGTTEDLFHAFICGPVVEWCYKKINMESVDCPYYFLKKKFPKDFQKIEDDCNWSEDLLEEESRRQEGIGGE